MNLDPQLFRVLNKHTQKEIIRHINYGKAKQLSNTCEMFVASLTRRFVLVKRLFTDLQSSLGGDETPRQTSHEHLNGKNMTQ